MIKTGFITEDYRKALIEMITKDYSKESLLTFIKTIPRYPYDPYLESVKEVKSIGTSVGRRPGERRPPERILRPGDKARYLENGRVVYEANTPNALAIILKIPRHNGKTIGVQGYRTILHAFTANNYEVDIGEGWGDYSNEYNKPYRKFDVRKKP
jgi:hypothetical protein